MLYRVERGQRYYRMAGVSTASLASSASLLTLDLSTHCFMLNRLRRATRRKTKQHDREAYEQTG